MRFLPAEEVVRKVHPEVSLNFSTMFDVTKNMYFTNGPQALEMITKRKITAKNLQNQLHNDFHKKTL